MGLFTTAGHAIGATVDMAWDTWWALVLGFTITGVVELFTTEAQMTEYLGDDEATRAAPDSRGLHIHGTTRYGEGVA